MKRQRWLAHAAVLVCGMGAAAAHAADTVNIPLRASAQNAGQTGSVALASQGSETSLLFIISGVTRTTTRPLRVYTFIYEGSCASHAEKPAYSMNQTLRPVNDTPAGPWRFSRSAPIAYDRLVGGNYAFVVRAGPWDGGMDLFCGEIGTSSHALGM
ncbi:hypothetical protein SAMN05192539_100337 [Paraburkholderia diazotrophica]|uniref:Uncharacterized protein n=1 Tax=Paraburkholderia diazotrophica TaxID=667676 RepID=A0A1H6S2A9_9BURK|nr:hypothetical protein SAMN05192539_100337 [Paraburkholderia diazotrophica]